MGRCFFFLVHDFVLPCNLIEVVSSDFDHGAIDCCFQASAGACATCEWLRHLSLDFFFLSCFFPFASYTDKCASPLEYQYLFGHTIKMNCIDR